MAYIHVSIDAVLRAHETGASVYNDGRRRWSETQRENPRGFNINRYQQGESRSAWFGNAPRDPATGARDGYIQSSYTANRRSGVSATINPYYESGRQWWGRWLA